ncbi:Predicted E3 ubiquitin ligase [Plasmopara halstedii]|uniref:Predicted E3 ubiquitin ligase n=1 Tax=Plasmopara halstedii TaxID=4781 RepID=A0A0P1B5T9_PLAHL|nr:Predicted E3 ubiquitin ligase [Plasmopara halstedii]CEG49196.1 Predicted E3 ubiquitin ligase [Plasmopara halstedii]|eukprot:XP_024585565.1 Predicted E3 ubiquitin ligase [Plasmopara halstedii]
MVNEADESTASASLARLRLFLSSHAPNGQEKAQIATQDCLSNLMASIAPLSQSSKEFERVKYLLQCSLPGYRVHENVVISDLQNPSLVAQYEQHTAGLLELDSWVAVNDLGKDLADVHSYGFTSYDATDTNMKFTTGNLQFSAPLDQSRDAKNHPSSTRQLVLCKIAVGRSLAINDEKEAKARLPIGYHSYYLHQDASGTQDQYSHRGYYHEYILTNTMQILPQYLVRFTYSAANYGIAIASCALCEQHPAVVTCRNCEAQICAQCDHEVHSANKLVRRHKRTPVKSQARNLGSENIRRDRRRSSNPSMEYCLDNIADLKETEEIINAIIAKQMDSNVLAQDVQHPTCRSHSNKLVEFFCPVCQVAVCVSCKMIGDHSIGEKGSHRLLTVADAYESCIRESLRPDPLIMSRKSAIGKKLQLLSGIQQSVQSNKTQVANAINELCARVLQELNEASATKMRILSGEMLELERQSQQIDWVEESLQDHRTILSAVEFLSAWNEHKKLRAQQRECPNVAHNNHADQVQANLHLAGNLHIIVADQVPEHLMSIDEKDPIFQNTSANTSNQNCNSDTNSQPEIKAAAILAQHRRSGDNVRTQLLNMKPTLPHKLYAHRSRRVVSPKCQQVLDEIRQSILVQTSARKSALSPCSPISSPLKPRVADMTSTFRAFSVHSSMKKTPDNETRQRRTSVWSTLLRQEMGLPN